ncbi:MAG: type IV pilus modification protein PilV [Oceanococcaceae bacterium]
MQIVAGKRYQSGLSLLEVLVAVIVLSIGFLGYAALQMLGVRTSDESLYRTQALMLADSMAERMYQNRSAINDDTVNGGNSLYDGLDSDGMDCGAPAVQCDRSQGAEPANCSVAQLVAFDAYSVFCGSVEGAGAAPMGIRNLLPEGRLTVRCAGVGGCLPTSPRLVTVTWEETETDQDPQADQDGDGSTEYMTRTVSVEVVP